MTLEAMKELFGVTHVRDDEEEVPIEKCMHGEEEEVSLSQPITATVPSEEEDVPVPQGLCPLPLGEEDVPVLLDHRPVAVPPEEEVPQGSPVMVPLEEEEVPAPPPLSRSRRKEGDTLSLYCPW
jgi:hypothetical protein